ncbi:hypothetical protein UCRPA7_733 [Phaeoacremonium minimum UCRPA7]|uniref:GDS1 winged helix domain-containing protein n=1 Tax=Phaeoacremonium minimum (strain UCR-PA7) TaxID=1286976 RepID=R8BWF9_PHAM7|nr:hypothetical protein UCRPA7_733 [Phaeoacremonium minimum UCRPA7]EOO03683.1 hypothetical protein UCRPA7_733 [Phaeoacremonium minimum UCRPA7]
MDAQQHPNKKIKRSHGDEAQSPVSTPAAPKKFNHTPPPSPHAERSASASDESTDAAVPVVKKVDLEGINDEIVEAVIVQLQDTGNRPYLVKELATILMQQLKIVQQSANPCAIISSRLSSYLKRSCWTALAPCPLAKELETVHPRRTYFYLTTCPHQPLPGPAAVPLAQRAIVTPSLSSATSTSEDADEERRRELSPSPEVDLSSPEFDDMDDDIPMPSTPIGSLTSRQPQISTFMAHNQRGASPPLEKDEKEFTQTADGLQKRKLTGDLLSSSTNPVENNMDLDDGRDDSLFGDSKTLSVHQPMAFITSPAIRPSFAFNLKKEGEAESWAKLDNMLEWDRSPENIELDELDGLLSGY